MEGCLDGGSDGGSPVRAGKTCAGDLFRTQCHRVQLRGCGLALLPAVLVLLLRPDHVFGGGIHTGLRVTPWLASTRHIRFAMTKEVAPELIRMNLRALAVPPLP